MKRFNGKAVASPRSPRQAKVAIDKIYQALAPECILLLGSIDVIPHQHLVNPVPGDSDPTVQSDLPYACGHGYSRRIEDFKAATR